jgi:hypothetical protein
MQRAFLIVHLRVIAHREGRTRIAFMSVPHGSEVDKENVVVFETRVSAGALVEFFQPVFNMASALTPTACCTSSAA